MGLCTRQQQPSRRSHGGRDGAQLENKMLNLCTINLKRKQNTCSREEMLFHHSEKHQHEGLCDFLSCYHTAVSSH